MKVVGRYEETVNYGTLVARGGYVAIEVQSAYVETYNGKSVDECNRCLVVLCSGYYYFHVQKKGDEYLSPDAANKLVMDIASKELVNLDSYGMALFSCFEIRPDSIAICNETDENGNPIPVEVTME